MSDKNDEQLRYVIQNQHQFDEKEVHFAQEILLERGVDISKNTDSSGNQDTSTPNSYYLPATKTSYSLRALATYQIISSLLVLPYIFSIGYELTAMQWVLFTWLFGIYVTMLVSGVLIYMKRKNGAFIAVFANLFQCVQFQMFGLYYSITGFMHLFINIGQSQFVNLTLFGARSSLSVNAAQDVSFIGFNIFAIVATYIAFRAYQYWEDNNELPLHLY